MKNLLLCSLLMLASTASVFGVINDDFGASHDFIADGVAGTVWDGVVVNGGTDATQDAVLSALDTSTTTGVLRFETSNTQWEADADDGALLYINVTGDFVATVQITDGQFPSLPAGGPVAYLSAGLMARSTVVEDKDYLYFNAFDRSEWGATHQFRSANEGNVEYLVTNSGDIGNPSLESMPWLRLERAGSLFTAYVSADGSEWTLHSSFDRPDMPAETQVGIAHATFSGEAGWVEFDNFSLAIPNITYDTPEDAADLVAIDTMLEWSFTSPSDEYFDLYFSTENDPNLTTKPEYKMLSMEPVTTTSFDPGILQNDTVYYWRIDTYEPDPTPGSTAYIVNPGKVASFTTVGILPLLTNVEPTYYAVEAGEASVSLVVEGKNVETYQWYKGDAVALTDGADFSGVNTNTLIINDVQLADEGTYYCVGTNEFGSDDSLDFKVLTKRLMSYYPFEVINTDGDESVTPDVISGFDAVLKQEGTAGLPVIDDEFQLDEALGSYLVLDNGDNDTDPNGQYAEISGDLVGYEDVTVSVWVQSKSLLNWSRIIDFGSGVETDPYMFITSQSSNDAVHFGIAPEGSGSEQSISVAPVYPNDQWFYVAVTIEGDTGRLFINGERVAINTEMTANPLDLGTVVNYIGKSSFVADQAEFDGMIDDLKIYNYALSTVEVAQEYLAHDGDWVCNREGTEDLVYDFNSDCNVDINDFAQFATTWLNSNRVYPLQ